MKKQFKRYGLYILAYMLMVPIGIGAQTVGDVTTNKIMSTDALPDDNFGVSTAISGDTAIVGASGEDTKGDFAGAAYIFVRNGDSWTQQAKLLPPDNGQDQYFGAAVSISGNYAIIGAYGDKQKGESAGAAYIFRRDGANWIQAEKLIASDASPYHFFGCSVSIYGEDAIVGAYGNSSLTGAVYVFHFDGTRWIQQAKLTADDATAEDSFGRSVSIFGDYALVGAYGNDDYGTNSGSAYIFKRTQAQWVQQTKLIPKDGAINDQFGISVSIYGDYGVIGASGKDADTGAAYIFRRIGNTWTQQVKLTEPEGHVNHAFGYSVSVYSARVVIGAFGRNTFTGAAYTCRLDGGGMTRLLAGDGALTDQFGYSVGVSDGYAIFGAYGHDRFGTNAGASYLYRFQDSGNLPPSISDIPNQTTRRNTPVGPLDITVFDPENAAITITADSSDTAVIPAANIVITDSGIQRTLTLTPAVDKSGSSTITLTATDGINTVFKSFTVTVNDPPVISDIPNQAITGSTTGPIAFTIHDTETPPNLLILSAKASDTVLIPPNSILFGGSGSDRTVTIIPASKKSGAATVIITVSDGIDSVSDEFQLTVTIPNILPTITPFSDQTTNEDIPAGPLSFTIQDSETPADQLTVWGVSSNPDIVTSSGIVFEGSGADRRLTVYPVLNASGSVMITVVVDDGVGNTSASFTLTILPVNDAPILSIISDRFMDASSTSSITIPFTAIDPEGDPVTFSGDSSDYSIVPKQAIVFGVSDGKRTVTITPVSMAFGVCQITITASDGNASASREFKLTVKADNDPPAISDIPDQLIEPPHTQTGTIPFTVADLETPVEELIVFAQSSNSVLIPDNAIVLGGYGANRALNAIPNADESGTAIITVTVSDGKASDTDTFTLTVKPVIRPGDMNHNGKIDLSDAILVFQILTEIVSGSTYIDVEVNGDGKIGIEEAIFILQKIVGARESMS